MSDSVRPHRGQPTRLPRPWDSPGQEHCGVGCHFLLQCMKVKSVYSPTYIYIFSMMPWENTHFLLIFMYRLSNTFTWDTQSHITTYSYCSYDQVNGPLAIEPKKSVSYPVLGSISMASEWKKRYLLESTLKLHYEKSFIIFHSHMVQK